MALTSREKIIIAVSTTLVLGVGYFRFAIMPINKEMAALDMDYKSKQAMIEQTERKEVRMKEINNETKNLDKSIQTTKLKVLSPIRVPEMLDELDKAATANIIALDNISFSGDAAAIKGEYMEAGKSLEQPQQPLTDPASQVQTPKVKLLTINMSFTGKYENLLNFIKYYETNQRLFITDILDISFNGDTCQGILVLQTYSIPEDDSDFLYIVSNPSYRANPY